MLKFAIKLLINKFQINRYISWVQITFGITFSNITPFNIYIYIYILNVSLNYISSYILHASKVSRWLEINISHYKKFKFQGFLIKKKIKIIHKQWIYGLNSNNIWWTWNLGVLKKNENLWFNCENFKILKYNKKL